LAALLDCLYRQAKKSVRKITGTIIISIRIVDMTMRSRCWAAISPDGDTTTILHPASPRRSEARIVFRMKLKNESMLNPTYILFL
jgi:hypothetical protein